MRPIRVAMIIQRFLPFTGGAERQLAAVAGRLREHGIEPIVVTRRHDESPPFETIDGISVHRVATPGPRPLASMIFTVHSLRILRQVRADIVHAHELLSPTTTALAYKALTGRPVIAKVLRGGSIGDIGVLSRSRLGRLRLGVIRRSVDVFAVISREIDDELAALGVPAARRAFLPNGVDVDRYRPAAEDQKRSLRRSLALPDTPLALFTGRLEPEKGLAMLVSLWPRVRAAVPGATLVVAGVGSMLPFLQRSGTEGVLLVGNQADVVPWYQAADAFVLPSVAEGLSNALLEAMACGLPCIATRVGGASELFADEASRLLIPPNDERALEAALVTALGNEHQAADLGVAARRRILRDYALDVTVGRLAATYKALIDEA